MSNRRANVFALSLLLVLVGEVRGQEEAVPPRRIEVLPVFFIPKGERAPTVEQAARLERHLWWAQERYTQMLGVRDTFAISGRKPHRYWSTHPLGFYREKPEGAAPQFVGELLDALGYTRYNCPYVMLVVLMNPVDDFPVGGGRPINGGFDTGGGIVILASFALDRSPNFQSTLQHELGHSFGLPHVDAYGYDMQANGSIMSYNPHHHTDGFAPSRTPGRLIPEDIRGLALNRRAFPRLRFDPERDVPAGYAMADVQTLEPMTIPGQPDGVEATTRSGELYGSKVAHAVRGRIAPSERTGKVTFNPETMWHSDTSADGWVSIDVTFPYEVNLTRLGVHSQHSGQYHAAERVEILVARPDGAFLEVASADLDAADAIADLPPTKGKSWRFRFRAGSSGMVVLRGLQFFSGDDELFPPLVPWRP